MVQCTFSVVGALQRASQASSWLSLSAINSSLSVGLVVGRCHGSSRAGLRIQGFDQALGSVGDVSAHAIEPGLVRPGQFGDGIEVGDAAQAMHGTTAEEPRCVLFIVDAVVAHDDRDPAPGHGRQAPG